MSKQKELSENDSPVLQHQIFAGKQISTNDFTCGSQGGLLQ